MKFLFDRPCIVDTSKFRSRFWLDVVPFEVGLAATARSCVPRDAADVDTQPALPSDPSTP
ncbi:hypothetical protein [Cypionkella sp.]|uniref:hypothetical protein n=1 Tax=Cypionkella sp. TaxID=2811411 RepID=UPI002625FA54|nr:hypothetical protein [Cypionkella sp.]